MAAEPDDHGLGRSQGGLTKLHLAADASGHILVVVVTGGQRDDAPQFTEVRDRIHVLRPGTGPPLACSDHVIVDRAYSSCQMRDYLRQAADPAHRSGEARPGWPPSAPGLGGRASARLRPRTPSTYLTSYTVRWWCAFTTARSPQWTSPTATRALGELLSTVKFMAQTLAAVGELPHDLQRLQRS
ncbi:transposase [Streptomyces oryzae]|uniref:transposase n=1 Tax=Streptomyces oryzae TaxID=1434886 RepID=UPI001FFE102D|nr:transposase [Streptomyces oryzae]